MSKEGKGKSKGNGKYHVNNEGNADECEAKTLRGCPFGKHYETKQEAMRAYEKSQSDKTLVSVTKASQNKAKTNTKNRAKPELLDAQAVDVLTERMYAEYQNMYQNLSDSQQHSIKYYSKGGYEKLNPFLREQSSSGDNNEDKERLSKHVENLDAIMTTFGHHQEPKKVYRYIELSPDENVDYYVRNNFGDGETYVDNGYMSTSEDLSFVVAHAHKHKGQSKFVILEIDTNKGISLQDKKTEFKGKIQSYEKERLLPRGSSFTVGQKKRQKLKVDDSRETLFREYNASDENSEAEPIPAMNVEIISLEDEDIAD